MKETTLNKDISSFRESVITSKVDKRKTTNFINQTAPADKLRGRQATHILLVGNRGGLGPGGAPDFGGGLELRPRLGARAGALQNTQQDKSINGNRKE
jgi:hypothetical protein